MITSAELRTRFKQFFEQRGHLWRESDSLIPSGDPTVLFTSAGMNQFKDYLLGKRTDLARAASCQKCLRAGDLDRVGKSASHHTFFEMLGNFSFGDYFKREAIQWAWEFLTGTDALCLGLPAEHLWVSVYEEDAEAQRLWHEVIGLPTARIKRFGQADNFWPANAPMEGPNGPCGPCSEIYFDRDGAVHGPNSVEVWNLVFTQFDRQPDGSVKPLPKPNIDTGMGLERLTRVIQGTETDYETDLFAPIIEAIRALPRGKKVKRDQVMFAERAIADHLRAIVFLAAEGLTPSNEGRGYVLRMLIRRAYRLARVGLDLQLSQADGVLHALAPSVETAMASSSYHALLAQKRHAVSRIIQQEETQFIETLQTGTARLEEMIAQQKSLKRSAISGEEAFKLYDTYGFPLELTVDIAAEQGCTIERAGFDRALKAQQARSRAGSQFSGGVFVAEALEVRKAIPALPSKEELFVGYEQCTVPAVIKGIWDGARWIEQAREGQQVAVVLERSPFYGEAGGQIGDTGYLEGPSGLAEVSRTTWVDETLVHQATIRQGGLTVQERVQARVDPERRLKVARSHTAAHLLHWALRKVLGPETVQAGSYVEAERVRFDFSSRHGLHEEQRAEVEALVNARARLADEVTVVQMRLQEAKQDGALALFGEKYGERVRVVSIGDYSKELCGGTHLPHTGLLGAFLIVGESSIAAGTRRVEALVGEAAAHEQQAHERVLHEAAKRLGRSAQDVVAGLEELLEQLKRSERARKTLQLELAHVQAGRLVAQGKVLNGLTFVAATIAHADRELLAALADAVRGQLKMGAVLLVSTLESRDVAWVLALTADVVARKLHAGALLKEIAAITQGGGGGRPDFAQAGGKDPSKIPQALQRAEELLREALG